MAATCPNRQGRHENQDHDPSAVSMAGERNPEPAGDEDLRYIEPSSTLETRSPGRRVWWSFKVLTALSTRAHSWRSNYKEVHHGNLRNGCDHLPPWWHSNTRRF
jgi:hypothetical protein